MDLPDQRPLDMSTARHTEPHSPLLTRCPKCGQHPLPQDQRLPAACPRCGVILAKVAQPGAGPASRRGSAERPAAGPGPAADRGAPAQADEPPWWDVLVVVPDQVAPLTIGLRVALLALFAVWGLRLIGLDHRSGAIGESFLHGPLLVFHEAGHVLFGFAGEWLMFLGGTLGQLLMPAVMTAALLVKNRDPFGAAFGLWLLGVSLLDVAPYLHDAADPRLILLSGVTGEQGGHDWIYLLSSIGLLQQATVLGALTHKLGALVVLVALGWAAWLLQGQWRCRRRDLPGAG